MAKNAKTLDAGKIFFFSQFIHTKLQLKWNSILYREVSKKS